MYSSLSQQQDKVQSKLQEMFNRLIERMNGISQSIIDSKFDIDHEMTVRLQTDILEGIVWFEVYKTGLGFKLI